MKNNYSTNYEKLAKLEKRLFWLQKIANNMLDEYAQAYGYADADQARCTGIFEKSGTWINLEQICGGIGGAIDYINK